MCVTTLKTLGENLNSYVTAAGNGEKVYVATDTGNAVIVSEEYLRGLEETLYLLSIPEMKDKLADALSVSSEECVKIDWRKELA